ncbi:MAG: polysaccharide deacetylase family protein [Myxococcales bacterium]|nr:polysaccharide deacetylase family protein [Myxococcales bacterium]
MRRVVRVLALVAVAAALPQASARPEPAPLELPVALAGTTVAFARAPEQPLPRVIDVAPLGARVALDAPLVVRFDGPVPSARRSGVVELEPEVAGEARWNDDSTWTFTPKRWRQGRPQRVRVRPPSGDPIEWTFRARVPMPLAPVAGEGARLVLTFDDGPNDRRQADRLLDRLKELRIRALFFPSGRWAQTRPDWVLRARDEGHRVCNHTFSHVNLTAPWMTEARITDEIVRGAGDGDCKLFRPPLMGVDARVERIAKTLGYEVYLWDVDSRDWEGGPAEDVLATALGQARPEAVVLFHIHADATFQILPTLAERLRAAGYVLSWDPADAPSRRVGLGGRPEWGALTDRPTDAETSMADADLPGLGPP